MLVNDDKLDFEVMFDVIYLNFWISFYRVTFHINNFPCRQMKNISSVKTCRVQKLLKIFRENLIYFSENVISSECCSNQVTCRDVFTCCKLIEEQLSIICKINQDATKISIFSSMQFIFLNINCTKQLRDLFTLTRAGRDVVHIKLVS